MWRTEVWVKGKENNREQDGGLGRRGRAGGRRARYTPNVDKTSKNEGGDRTSSRRRKPRRIE
jgi:hypothetical protein